jgi:hypothetical protein
MLMNWLSTELMDKVAEIIQVLPIEVYEVVSFYTMYWNQSVVFVWILSNIPLLPQRNGD